MTISSGTLTFFNPIPSPIPLAVLNFGPQNATPDGSVVGFEVTSGGGEVALATPGHWVFAGAAIPEPSGVVLMGLGLAGVGWMARRRHRGA